MTKQAIRVAGRLEAISFNDRSLVLELEDGARIRGVTAALEPQQLASYLGREVVIAGLAYFDSGGQLLRLVVEALAPATVSDSQVWNRHPRPAFLPLTEHEILQPQDPETGINAVIGKWPGDESEEEFLAALAELS